MGEQNQKAVVSLEERERRLNDAGRRLLAEVEERDAVLFEDAVRKMGCAVRAAYCAISDFKMEEKKGFARDAELNDADVVRLAAGYLAGGNDI
jgi:hypothetical protein